MENAAAFAIIVLIESNLVNSKSSGLVVLFRIISSSNYREVNIEIYNRQNEYYQRFFFIKHMFWARKKGLMESFFTQPKLMLL